MKLLPRIALALCLTQLLAAQQLPDYRARSQHLQVRIDSLASHASFWPPNVEDTVQLRAIRDTFAVVSRELESLYADYPDSSDLLFRLGLLYYYGHNLDVEGAWDKSNHFLTQSINAQPNNPDSYFQLAVLYVNTNPQLAPTAEKLIQKAIDLSGDHPNPYLFQSLCLSFAYQGKYEEALDAIDQFLKREPDNRMGISIRSTVLKKLGR